MDFGHETYLLLLQERKDGSARQVDQDEGRNSLPLGRSQLWASSDCYQTPQSPASGKLAWALLVLCSAEVPE